MSQQPPSVYLVLCVRTYVVRVRVCVCVAVPLSNCLSVCLFICLFVYLSTFRLSICLPVYFSYKIYLFHLSLLCFFFYSVVISFTSSIIHGTKHMVYCIVIPPVHELYTMYHLDVSDQTVYIYIYTSFFLVLPHHFVPILLYLRLHLIRNDIEWCLRTIFFFCCCCIFSCFIIPDENVVMVLSVFQTE